MINPENSKIEFVGSKVTGSHNGSFQKFAGEVHYTGDVTTSHVTITMQSDSLMTDTPDLTKHLKTADFFDVAKYPEAKFESTAIKPGGDKGASHTITGNLTLHGVTKSVTFPATIAAAPDAITVDSTFTINRKDFGINYAGAGRQPDPRRRCVDAEDQSHETLRATRRVWTFEGKALFYGSFLRSYIFTYGPIDRRGSAAGCEARLCLAGWGVKGSGAVPLVWPLAHSSGAKPEPGA